MLTRRDLKKRKRKAEYIDKCAECNNQHIYQNHGEIFFSKLWNLLLKEKQKQKNWKGQKKNIYPTRKFNITLSRSNRLVLSSAWSYWTNYIIASQDTLI